MQRENPVDKFNDFWMGYLVGLIGIVCATIIDKREGFWVAFVGFLISSIAYAITVVLCIYKDFFFGISIGFMALIITALFSLAFLPNSDKQSQPR